MAIQYLDSKRIRGNLELTPTWTADFSQTGTNYEWSAQDETTSGGYMKIDTANSELDYKAYRDNTNDAISFDLQQSSALGSGNNVHATAWVLRVQIDLDDIEDGHANGLMFSLGLSSENSTVAQAGNQDGIVIFAKSSSSSEETDWTSAWSNNQAAVVGANTQDLGDAILAEGRWYIEIKRTDSDKATVRVTRSSDYTGGYSHSYTNLSGVDNLRYFKACNNAGSEMTNYIEGKIKSIKLWNGVTSATIDDKASLVTPAVAAITGWDNVDGSGAYTLTAGTGIIVNASSSHQNTAAVYDLGTSGQLTPDDDWVCDYTVTRNSSDVFDHPMLMFKSQNTGYGTGVPNNGDNQILFQYWANGATNDQSGSNVMNTRFRAGGTEYETGAQVSVGSNNANIPAIGTTLYYRITMNARAHTMSAWTTSDDRTAGSTDSTRVVHATGSALNSSWDQSDPLRYVMVIHRNNNNGRWTISDFKFWNATTSTSGTPNVAFTFTDVPASSDLPENTLFEETDTRKTYFLQSDAWEEGYPRSPTWETDLSSSSGWSNDNTADLEVTGGVIQYKDNDYNYETTYYDMTAIDGITGGISNTAWILRFKWYITGTASVDDPLFAFSFTEDASQATTDNGDALGFYIYHDRNNSWRKYFNITKADTASTRGTASVIDEGFTYSNNTWYWTEIKRDGSTLTIKTFDSADYDTQILDSGNNTAADGTITAIIPSGVGTLRYLTAGHHTQGQGLTVQIDDIKFWDGVSEL